MKEAALPGSASSPLADFASLERYLDSLGLFRITPGLERIRDVLGRLELIRPPYLLVQVAGTNGKGSTTAMLAGLGQAHGLRVGLHTSPHFVHVRERIRINGAPVEEDLWVRLANGLLCAGGESLSYFEFITALAVLAFAAAKVDLAVMETGLGGRWDATTALAADALLLTPIGLDHQAVLGAGLTAIARDKAGAIRPGVPVFSLPQEPEAWTEILRAARAKSSPLILVDPGEDARTPALPLRLEGPHQRANAALALAGWRMLRPGGERPARQSVSPFPASPLERRGLASAWLPGRLQSVPPLTTAACLALPAGHPARVFRPSPLGWPPLLLDGAHNSHAFAALEKSLSQAGIAPAAVIFACLKDKNPRLILPHLRALAAGPVFVPPLENNSRAIAAHILAGEIKAAPVSSLEDALRRAAAAVAASLPEAFGGGREKRPILLCGSLYLLGDFFALRPDCLEPPPYSALLSLENTE
ncbi:MAG: bifunctional folylpolyglutamate synthase/dihydrofolate synthase [Desulfovibrio sp.]|jgi:dihydrofolate synthase/folylpolyglutamate synthase|nr:bifunctional folylpolyglutamate synthase/dihydrofolate synthase [Desulfovibrio sp.]